MAYRCDLCSKGKSFGLSHRHHRGVAGGQWKKRAQKTAKLALPNLHTLRAEIGGVKKIWKLCTKCQRLIKEELKSSASKKEAPKAEEAKPAKPVKLTNPPKTAKSASAAA